MILTSVDFPQPIPPVSPNILIFLIFIPTAKIMMQGKRVLKKGFIYEKIVLARTNYIIAYLHSQ